MSFEYWYATSPEGRIRQVRLQGAVRRSGGDISNRRGTIFDDFAKKSAGADDTRSSGNGIRRKVCSKRFDERGIPLKRGIWMLA